MGNKYEHMSLIHQPIPFAQPQIKLDKLCNEVGKDYLRQESLAHPVHALDIQIHGEVPVGLFTVQDGAMVHKAVHINIKSIISTSNKGQTSDSNDYLCESVANRNRNLGFYKFVHVIRSKLKNMRPFFKCYECNNISNASGLQVYT